MINSQSLLEIDPAVAHILAAEHQRQTNVIELIASENFVSRAVLEAQGSVLTNKYAEGYPGRRYYCGCEEVDKVENLAIDRLKQLFDCSYANVQPNSGSQANQAVFLALLKPGDTILGMSLDSGGHLTHGSAPNLSGKWFNSVNYSVDPTTFLVDYDIIEAIARKTQPKLIIAGFSAYSRSLDFAKFRQIADKVGAYLMADIAHISGIIAAKEHMSPLPYAHVVTSTTHKTLRGPRGGILLSNDLEIGKKLNSAVFPGLQGGPLMHVIAAKAVAFHEALQPSYLKYIHQVIQNAKSLSETLQRRDYNVLTGGTDNHIVLLDLRKDRITGKDATNSLERAGITANKNAIPFDITPPSITSGIRFGTPACTTRGFTTDDFVFVGNKIADILDVVKSKQDTSLIEKNTMSEIRQFISSKFNPISITRTMDKE